MATGMLVILALLSLLLVPLTLSPGEKIIKRIVEAKLEDLLGQQVQIGMLETNLLSRFQAQDILISQIQYGDTIPVLNLGHAKIHYRLIDLLWGRLTLRSLNLDNLFLTIKRDSSGLYNVPLLNSDEKPDSNSSPFSFPVQLNKAILKNASIQYLDFSVPMIASLNNLNFTAEYRENETYLYHVEVDSSLMEYQGIPLTAKSIYLDGLWSSQQLRLDSLSVLLPDLEFRGNAELVQKAEYSSINGDFALRGNPGLLLQTADEGFPHKLPSIQGGMDLALHVEGSLEQPKLSMQLDFPELNIAEIRLRKGSIQAKLEPGLVSLDQLSFQLLGGNISAEGRFSPDSLFAHQLSVSVDGVDLSEVWQFLYDEPSPYQGKIHSNLTVSGPLQDPRSLNLLAEINLKKGRYHSKSLPDFSAKLIVQQSLANFWLHQENSDVSAEVKLDGEQLQGQFSAKIFQLEPLAGLANVSELTGGMEIQGVIQGKLESPEVAAAIKAEEIRYQNFPVDSLRAHVLYRDGKAHVSDLDFAGNLDPIDTLQPPFHLSNIAGGITYCGHASGPADSLSGGLTINMTQIRYGDMRFDEGLIRVGLDGQRIDLLSAQLLRDSLLIQAGGEFHIPSAKGKCEIALLEVPPGYRKLLENVSDLEQKLGDNLAEIRRVGNLTATFSLYETYRFSLQVAGEQLDLGKIQTLVEESPDIGGLLKFYLDFSGNLDNPHAELNFQMQQPRFQLVEMDSLVGHLTFNDAQFEVQRLELYQGDHRSLATAVVVLEKGESGSYFISDNSLLQGRAQGGDFDLRLLSPLLSEETQIAGRASYNFSWDGTLANPHPVGTLAIQDGMVQPDPNGPALQEINVTLFMEDSILNIENVKGVIQETPFHLQGQVAVSQWERFNLQINLSISDFATIVGNGMISRDSIQFNARIKRMDLSLLQPFFPDFGQLSGTLNTEVALSGSTSDPQLDGHLEVRELTLQPSWVNAPFSEGIIKLDFNQKEAKVDSLFMRANEGTIFLSGKLTHQRGELENANLQIDMNNVTIDRPKEIILSIKSVQLGYKRQNNYYLLDGDIVLGESRMLVNFRPQSILPFAQAVERPKQELPSFLQQTRMDVRLRESEKIWIDNNLARLRLHTELSIIGSPVQPNLTGHVTVEEGYLLYLDRKFKIKQGVVDFVDPERLNPIIDFIAQTSVTSYRATEATPYVITLAITGPLDEVVVELTSDPPQDKSNILSLLTLGATREELAGKDAEGKEGSFSAVLKERAGSLSSQKIAGYTSRKVGGLLGLEQFTIEGNLFRFDQSWGPQLLASKKISPRMEITYITTVGHSNENSFRLDYRLSKHFSLEGQTDQQGRTGMNLKYRLRSK